MERQIDRRGWVDRLIDGEIERTERREEEDLGFFAHRSAPGSLFLHSEINPVKQPQSLEANLVFFHPRSKGSVPGSWFWQQEINRKKKKKKLTGNKRRGATERESFRVCFSVSPAKQVRPPRANTQFVRRG